MPDIIRNKIGSFPRYLWEDEARIIDAFITEAFKRDLCVSVHDGEEFAIERSFGRDLIQKEVAATDETYLHLFKGEEFVGWVRFIHGNRADVLSDHTVTPVMEEITKAIEPLTEMLGNN